MDVDRPAVIYYVSIGGEFGFTETTSTNGVKQHDLGHEQISCVSNCSTFHFKEKICFQGKYRQCGQENSLTSVFNISSVSFDFVTFWKISNRKRCPGKAFN